MGRRRAADPKKTAVRVTLPKPRNPIAVAARKRAAGPHGPSRKAERAVSKAKLRQRPEDA